MAKIILSHFLLLVIGIHFSPGYAQQTSMNAPEASIEVKRKFEAYVAQVKSDEALAQNVVKQAQLTLQQLKNGADAKGNVLDNSWGPARHKTAKLPFGWGLETIKEQKLLILYDVHVEIAQRFNAGMLGRNLVYRWHAVSNEGRNAPYGVLKPEWGNSIVLPVAWLEDQRYAEDRLKQYRSGKINLTGLGPDQDELEKYNLAWFDRFTATGVVYSKVDLTQTPNALENLASHKFNTLQLSATREIQRIKERQASCKLLGEAFARKDCLEILNLTFAAYGKKFLAFEQFLLAGNSQPSIWNASKSQLEFGQLGLRGELCESGLICESFALFGEGRETPFSPQNLVCYRLPEAIPVSLNVPMTEMEARRLSEKSAANQQLNRVAFLIKVTQQPNIYPISRKCKDSEARIAAEGRGIIAEKMIWSGKTLEFMAK